MVMLTERGGWCAYVRAGTFPRLTLRGVLVLIVAGDLDCSPSNDSITVLTFPAIAFQGNEDRQGYNEAVDWWSLGVTTYKMLTGARPFDPPPWARKKSVLVLLRRQTEFEKLQAGVSTLNINRAYAYWSRERQNICALLLLSLFVLPGRLFGSLPTHISQWLWCALLGLSAAATRGSTVQRDGNR